MCFYEIRGFFIIDSPFPGPLVSALANKFGCRKVTILGSIVTALGFLVSTLAPSIEVLMFLYGVVGGWYSTIKVNVIAFAYAEVKELTDVCPLYFQELEWG